MNRNESAEYNHMIFSRQVKENFRTFAPHALPCRGMQKKWNFYVKVLVIEEEEGDVQKDRLSREIARQLQKIYGVRSAEVTSVTIE